MSGLERASFWISIAAIAAAAAILCRIVALLLA
jgi:hypothetical protein